MSFGERNARQVLRRQLPLEQSMLPPPQMVAAGFTQKSGRQLETEGQKTWGNNIEFGINIERQKVSTASPKRGQILGPVILFWSYEFFIKPISTRNI